MGCGCRKPDSLTADANGLAQSWPSTNNMGMVPLASAPSCTEAYHGMFKQATILVVGLGTEEETLFMRGERDKAIAMAKSQSLTIDPVPARELCHTPVLALLGN